ncbi:MAG: hypothetical protein M1827_006336 [Pycnora praestabilis]|nr:MAG: hypothetical protein M1827_006336 [Pycnora praestabilis]
MAQERVPTLSEKKLKWTLRNRMVLFARTIFIDDDDDDDDDDDGEEVAAAAAGAAAAVVEADGG